MVAENFPYGRQQFAISLLMFTMLLVVIPVVLLSIPGTENVVVLVLTGIVMVLILVFSVSPLLTAHQLDERRFVLRQGVYFKATIPLDDIDSVRRVDSGPRRTGTWSRTFESVLYVTTRRYDLVEIRLKREMRFGWALWKKADRVIFDTTDNGRFLRKMESYGVTLSNPVLVS